jgi:Spy/CpxP family protein refolding chaperone
VQRKEVISMRKTFVVVLVLVFGSTLAVSVALAWGPGFGPRFGGAFGGPGNWVPPIPGLTAEQSAKIQALRDGFQKEIEPLQQELATMETDLRDLWRSSAPDQTAILDKQQEAFQLQNQIHEKATILGLEIRKVLTPEQLAQLPAFRQDATFGPGAGFGPGGFGPPMGMRGPFARW